MTYSSQNVPQPTQRSLRHGSHYSLLPEMVRCHLKLRSCCESDSSQAPASMTRKSSPHLSYPGCLLRAQMLTRGYIIKFVVHYLGIKVFVLALRGMRFYSSPSHQPLEFTAYCDFRSASACLLRSNSTPLCLVLPSSWKLSIAATTLSREKLTCWS